MENKDKLPYQVLAAEQVHDQSIIGSSSSKNYKRIPGKNGKAYIVSVDQVLGKGAFATVCMGALEGQPNKQYAVKIIQQAKLKEKMGDRGVHYLQNEVTILSKIHHLNIVRLDEFYQTSKNTYLFFEMCAGGDLQKYIKDNGPLNEISAQKFMYQIGQALRQLCLNEVMHRDLKPGNILLNEPNSNAVLKLADFGLAKYYNENDEDDKDDMQNTRCGTPVYMAPEIENYEPYGPESDIWSCGVIFLEMLVGSKPWPGCTRKEEGPKKKAFFYRFSEGQINLSDYGIKISSLMLRLLRVMIVKDPMKRISWKDLFEHPCIKQGPQIYEELLITISQRNSTAASSSQNVSRPQLDLSDNKVEPSPFAVALAGSDKKSQQNDNSQNPQPKPSEFQNQKPQELQVNDFQEIESIIEPNSSASTGYVEDFIKSQDMTCQVIEILNQKADFLTRMVHIELHDEYQNVTLKQYKHMKELRYIIFMLVREIYEVIEAFSTKDFLRVSVSKDSDEKCVQNQIETKEQDQLLQSILNLKEKNYQIRSQYIQKIRQPRKSVSGDQDEHQQSLQLNNENIEFQGDDDMKYSILRVLHQDISESESNQAVPYKVVFTDILLQKLKESHGGKLIPIIHKLHEKYIYLSNHLMSFQDDISNGVHDNKKLLGKRLLNYVCQLSQDGAIFESNLQAIEAYNKYEQALFVCNELLRELKNTLKFSNEYLEEEQKQTRSPIKIRRSLEPTKIASFTFIRKDQWSIQQSQEENQDIQEQECMFDLKTEEILHGIRRMITKRMESVKKSAYFQIN